MDHGISKYGVRSWRHWADSAERENFASLARAPEPCLKAQRYSNKGLLSLLRSRTTFYRTIGDKAMECDELTGPKDIPEDFDDDNQDEDEDDLQEDLDFTGK